MKPRCARQRNHALTLVEALVVVAVVVVLAAMLLPYFAHAKIHGGSSCANNVKQIDLAMKIWAGDNNDKLPMEVSVTNGGTMELMNTPDAWKTFQTMSNELSTPKTIYCPKDSSHGSYATNWGDDLKNKISYFINLDANNTNQTMLVSGDDQFLLNQSPIPPGRVDVAATAPLEWNGDRHGTVIKQGWFTASKKIGYGNILLGDGSVQSTTCSALTNYLTQTGLATNRLFIP